LIIELEKWKDKGDLGLHSMIKQLMKNITLRLLRVEV
jgi:hypothetical protein